MLYFKNGGEYHFYNFEKKQFYFRFINFCSKLIPTRKDQRERERERLMEYRNSNRNTFFSQMVFCFPLSTLVIPTSQKKEKKKWKF